MSPAKTFNQPIIRSISAVAEEPIYSFTRRTIFSPAIANNFSIKFCAVAGDSDAKSESHIHPGDEVVMTLQGKNINYAQAQEFPLRQNQLIAIPPGTEHSTLVTGSGTWKGLSFYCDDCPHIKNNSRTPQTDVIKKSLKLPTSPPPTGLDKRAIFSPAQRESHYLEINTLSSMGPVPATQVTHIGETVYCVISGSFNLFWNNSKMVIDTGMAAAIPAGLDHKLSIDDMEGCLILVGSCSSCSLVVRTPE